MWSRVDSKMQLSWVLRETQGAEVGGSKAVGRPKAEGTQEEVATPADAA